MQFTETYMYNIYIYMCMYIYIYVYIYTHTHCTQAIFQHFRPGLLVICFWSSPRGEIKNQLGENQLGELVGNGFST